MASTLARKSVLKLRVADRSPAVAERIELTEGIFSANEMKSPCVGAAASITADKGTFKLMSRSVPTFIKRQRSKNTKTSSCSLGGGCSAINDVEGVSESLPLRTVCTPMRPNLPTEESIEGIAKFVAREERFSHDRATPVDEASF